MSLPNATRATQPDARPSSVWELYNEKAKIRDKALLKDWDSSINTLLLFAAIFAAVLTALCVKSRKLLEPDAVDSIRETLLYMAERSFNPSTPPPPSKQPFEAPDWAIIVNGFFFTSLTASILAAVGAVTCLQWVGEYDAGLEAASTPEHRALRGHYRYRATNQWYMPHMIAFLPILLYLAVGFFFAGLTVWFWQLHQKLALIPLSGILIWVVGYTITTFMAVFCPSAPYRTATSKALFRALFLAVFYIWKYFQTAIILYRPLLNFIRHFYDQGEYPWNEYRNQFILERIEFSRQMKSKLLEQYPWMPVGRDSRQAMHAHVWEQGRVARDETLHLSTIAWLANSIDLSEHSIPQFCLLLEELNKITETKLSEWPAYNYDAPWSYIFNMVLTPSSQTQGLNVAYRRDQIITTLAQLLKKMSLHPALFERMVPDLNEVLLVKFMRLLASEPPEDKDKARSRLESITCLLASKKWEEMETEKQPVMDVFKVILDCLNMMQASFGAPDVMTSWIFTLCHVDEALCDARAIAALRSWPNPELIQFIPDAFKNRELREHAVVHYLQFVDAMLCRSTAITYANRRWRWNTEAATTSQGRLILVELLGRHLLWTFFALNEPLEQQLSQDVFKRLLTQNMVSNSALRLIVMALGGYQQRIVLPPENDDLWEDDVWNYAVAEWYKFHTEYLLSVGDQTPTPAFLEVSAGIMRSSERCRALALDALVQLSTESHSPQEIWVAIFSSISAGDTTTLQAISSRMVGLHPGLWLEIFTHFHSSESSIISSPLPDDSLPNNLTSMATRMPITNAMLEAIRESLRKEVASKKLAETIAVVVNQNRTTTAKFLHLVNEIFQPERPRKVSMPPAYSMLVTIRELLRMNQDYATTSEPAQPLACLAVIIALSSTYTNGSMRVARYGRLFSQIARALLPLSKRYTLPPGDNSLMLDQNLTTNGAVHPRVALTDPPALAQVPDDNHGGDATAGATQTAHEGDSIDDTPDDVADVTTNNADPLPKDTANNRLSITTFQSDHSAFNEPHDDVMYQLMDWPQSLHVALSHASRAGSNRTVDTNDSVPLAPPTMPQVPEDAEDLQDEAFDGNWLAGFLRRVLNRLTPKIPVNDINV